MAPVVDDGTTADPTTPTPDVAAATQGATYEYLAGENTIQVLSPELTRGAQRIVARANASGVVFSLLFAPYPADPTGAVIWTPPLIQEQLAAWAETWNANAAVPGVAGISLGQDIDENGQLRDVALVIVRSTSGLSTTELTLYPHNFFSDTFPVPVATARAALDAAEVAA